MAYRNNGTAIGTYRTLEGSGLRDASVVAGQWADFQRANDGWAAYDRQGATWRITEAEAAVIAEGMA